MKCLFLYYNTALNLHRCNDLSVQKEYRLRAQGSSIHNGLAYLFSIAKAMQIESKLFDISYVDPTAIPQRFLEICEDFDPDILAISCFTQNWNGIKALLNSTFHHYPKKRPTIIIGGPHPTAAPEVVISFPLIDIIVLGEGEIAFYSILKNIQDGKDFEEIPGIWVRKKSGIIQNNNPQLIQNLDDLPIPDWDLFDQSYLTDQEIDFNIKPVGIFNTSRGCLYKCSYCTSSYYHELYAHEARYYREKSSNRIIGEIEEKHKRYRFSEIVFLDELFIKSLIRLKEFSKSYTNKIGLPFIAQTTPESINEETLSLIKEMGNKELRIGIECGNEEFRRNILKRNISNKLLIDKFKLIKKYDIKTTTYNIIGFPFETREMILETIELNKILEADQTYVNVFQPLPGTPLFNECVKNSLFMDPDHYNLGFGFDKSVIKTEVSHIELKYLKGMFNNVI